MLKEILVLVSAVSILLLGIIVYTKDRKSQLNKSFFLFTISSFIWSLMLLFYIRPVILSSEIWIKLTYTATIILIPPILYFCGVLCNKPLKFLTKLVIACFISYLPILPTLYITDWWVRDVIVTPQGVETMLGPVYALYGLIGGIYFLWLGLTLFKKHQQSSGTEKMQIRYIGAGILTYATFTFTVDVLLPLIFNNTLYFWTGPLSIVFLTVLTAFAIMKYHLFDIKVILTELLVTMLGTILCIQIFLSAAGQSRLISIGIFILYIPLGYLLVTSTHEEIKRRERIEQLVKELSEANFKIQSVEKMKSDLINMASHEFRTPIGIIKNALWFLNKKEVAENLAPKAKDNLEIVNHSVERLSELLQNMTEVLAASTGELTLIPEPTQVEILINDVISSKKDEAQEKDIALEFREPKRPLPQINADPTKLKYVLWELLNNSLKYTDAEDHINFSTKKEDRSIRIEIADTGRGISPAQLQDLFQKPFSKGDYMHTTQPGMGLGLYVVKNIMDMHHGKIDVASHEGVGTTVTLHFPLT